MQGLSPRNLKYMRQFAAAYPSLDFVQATLAQSTWYHHIMLLAKVKDEPERLTEPIPPDLKGTLPTIEELERGLQHPGRVNRKNTAS